MFSLSKTCLTTLFAAMAGMNVAAAEPLSKFNMRAEGGRLVDKVMGTQLMLLHSGTLGKNRIVVERARIDEVVGMICEWRTVGSIQMTADNRVKSITVEDNEFQCAPYEEADVPAQWFSAPVKSQEGQAAYTLEKDPENDDIVHQSVVSVSPMGVVSEFRRDWDLGKQTVCVKAIERIAGKAEPHITRDAGCYPIKNKEYFGLIRRLMQPGQPT